MSNDDEELARKLQAEFDAEFQSANQQQQQHQPASGPTVDVDTLLALQFQEEENKKLSQQQQQQQPSNPVSNPASNPPSHSQPKPPPFVPSKDPPKVSSDDEVKCLICMDEDPDEYVVLTACQIPHIYCMACARKLLDPETSSSGSGRGSYSYSSYNRRTSASSQKTSVQCPLCRAVTPLPKNGLTGLRRRKKKAIVNGSCNNHGQMIVYFCFDCFDLLCFQCVKQTHSNHQYDTLDQALAKIKSEMGSQVGQLVDKKKNYELFKQRLDQQTSTLDSTAQLRIKQLKEDMNALRQELIKKEEELQHGIEQMLDRKKQQANSEIKWANEKIQKINDGLQFTTQLADAQSQKSSPLDFFTSLQEKEDEILEIMNLPEKKIPVQSKKVVDPVRQLIKKMEGNSSSDSDSEDENENGEQNTSTIPEISGLPAGLSSLFSALGSSGLASGLTNAFGGLKNNKNNKDNKTNSLFQFPVIPIQMLTAYIKELKYSDNPTFFIPGQFNDFLEDDDDDASY